MAIQITIEKVLEQRDVDAALYLLGHMLDLDDAVLGKERKQLVALKRRLEVSRHITKDDRRSVIHSYREVIG